MCSASPSSRFAMDAGHCFRATHLRYLPSLVNIQKAIEHGPFIVSFPMKNRWIFHSYVSLPEGDGILTDPNGILMLS